MLNESTLMKNACGELIKIFGRQYLQDNYDKTLKAHGLVDDSTYMLFVVIKDAEDLPNRKANDKSWVVYGKVFVDAFTRKIINTEYELE